MSAELITAARSRMNDAEKMASRSKKPNIAVLVSFGRHFLRRYPQMIFSSTKTLISSRFLLAASMHMRARCCKALLLVPKVVWRSNIDLARWRRTGRSVRIMAYV